MIEENYIKEVKGILSSSTQADAKIDKIAKLELPKNASPLLALMNGDSLELQQQVEIEQHQNYIYDSAEEEQVYLQEVREMVAPKIIKKLNKYVQDWENGQKYIYFFELETLHAGLGYDSDINVEYVNMRFPTDATTIKAAVSAAKELQEHLLDRVVIYKNQNKGHKLDSVKPVYTVRNREGTKIASGRLELDGTGVSTWLNQL